MTREEIIAAMRDSFAEVETTYIGKKFFTATIQGNAIDTAMFESMVDEIDNIVCAHFTKPDQWDKESRGIATYKWIEIR